MIDLLESHVRPGAEDVVREIPVSSGRGFRSSFDRRGFVTPTGYALRGSSVDSLGEPVVTLVRDRLYLVFRNENVRFPFVGRSVREFLDPFPVFLRYRSFHAIHSLRFRVITMWQLPVY